MTVKIQFIDHRSERKSEELGPFEYVQLTYETLRVKEVGAKEEREDLSHFNLIEEQWEYDGLFWSDVCLY